LEKAKAVVELKKYNNSWYKPGSIVKRLLWLVVNQIFFKNGVALFNGFKCFLLKAFGARIGKNVIIKPSVNIKYPWFLSIGDYCWIGENVWIDNLVDVIIGNNVCISQGAMLLTGNHDFSKSSFDLIVKPITIEDGVWIGAEAIVCPGVYCETHSVLTVKSVASSRMESYTIYRGNPAIPIKERKIDDR